MPVVAEPSASSVADNDISTITLHTATVDGEPANKVPASKYIAWLEDRDIHDYQGKLSVVRLMAEEPYNRYAFKHENGQPVWPLLSKPPMGIRTSFAPTININVHSLMEDFKRSNMGSCLHTIKTIEDELRKLPLNVLGSIADTMRQEKTKVLVLGEEKRGKSTLLN